MVVKFSIELKCPYVNKCPKEDYRCFFMDSFKSCILYILYENPTSTKWDCRICGCTYDELIEKEPNDLICSRCKYLDGKEQEEIIKWLKL